jgi:hypothetical protein
VLSHYRIICKRFTSYFIGNCHNYINLPISHNQNILTNSTYDTDLKPIPHPMGSIYGDNMIHFIYYVITGSLAAWIFKITAGIFESIVMSPFGLITGTLPERAERNPRLFFTVLAIKNTIISLANATMIYILTVYFLHRFSGNFWLYVIASLIWSLYIVTINAYFPLSTIISSTGTLALYWFGLGYLAWGITGIVALLVSLAYYYGKINALGQQQYYQE